MKYTLDDFVSKAEQVHGKKYDYENTNYINSTTRVSINCPIHGEFWQRPYDHLQGCGCPKCGGTKKKDKEYFLEKASLLHGNKYDYSNVEYVNLTTHIRIICPIHGEFSQMPRKHLMGRGCPKCGGTKKLTTEEFIEKAKQIHGGKYDYSKVNYVNNSTKVCIVCPTHGEFWQTPNDHINNKCGCSKCGGTKKLTTEEFIEKAKQIHQDRYDYSKTKYINTLSKVSIICSIHGEFLQRPYDHLQGCGCSKCGGTKKLTTEEFIEKAKQVHQDRYDYSKVKYVNSSSKVIILCLVHGEFTQTPTNHLNGCGCPKCSVSTLENEIKDLLKYNDIEYVYEQRFDWLGKQSLDFYLPKYNVAIECQGLQHFVPFDFSGKNKDKMVKNLELVQERDYKKRTLCEEHNIKLLYYSNLHINYPYKVYENKEDIINEIKNGKE